MGRRPALHERRVAREGEARGDRWRGGRGGERRARRSELILGMTLWSYTTLTDSARAWQSLPAGTDIRSRCGAHMCPQFRSVQMAPQPTLKGGGNPQARVAVFLSVRRSLATGEAEPLREVDEAHGSQRTREPTRTRRLLVATFALMLAHHRDRVRGRCLPFRDDADRRPVALRPNEPGPVPDRRTPDRRRDPTARRWS